MDSDDIIVALDISSSSSSPPSLHDLDYRYVTSEDRERKSREYEHSITESFEHQNEEDDLDLHQTADKTIPLAPHLIPPNSLTPRQQEEADQPVREGMRYLFDNKFMRAKLLFQTHAQSDPLSSLGLGAMAFIQATMTHHELDIHVAVAALQTTYTIAQAQIVNTNRRPTSLMTSFTRYFGEKSTTTSLTFLANSILRAHVIKAEASLLIAILQLLRGSLVGYLRCGLHLRRAYYSYQLVWQEYKRMGQETTKYMDRDTVSGIQFGMGALQLILASLPAKVMQINTMVGWSCDKQLGFALLKLCTESRGIRSSLASLVLLGYYNILTSFAPQLYTESLMDPALTCLADAQHQQPRSSFFLYFAARFARGAHNLALSTQTFHHVADSCQGEWTASTLRHLTDHEQGMNEALQLNWEGCLGIFEDLGRQAYWSPAFSKYMVGACCEMMGQRTEAILAFAQVDSLIQQTLAAQDGTAGHRRRHILYIDTYLQKKVQRYQVGGYQDMDLHLPALEMLLVWNMFEWMEKDGLDQCLERITYTLDLVYERERMEFGVRQKTLLPATKPPNYHDQRASLLLIQAAVLNAQRQSQQAIPHLNWILDHRRHFNHDPWLVPFTYWESGVACWHLGQYKKSRRLWQQALNYTDYDFEYRLTVRLGLALMKCDEMGIRDGPTTTPTTTSNGRKRMPLA